MKFPAKYGVAVLPFCVLLLRIELNKGRDYSWFEIWWRGIESLFNKEEV